MDELFFRVVKNKFLLRKILSFARWNRKSYRYDELSIGYLAKYQRYDILREKFKTNPLSLNINQMTIREFLEFNEDFNLFLLVFKKLKSVVLESIKVEKDWVVGTVDHRWLEYLIGKKLFNQRSLSPAELVSLSGRFCNYQVYRLFPYRPEILSFTFAPDASLSQNKKRHYIGFYKELIANNAPMPQFPFEQALAFAFRTCETMEDFEEYLVLLKPALDSLENPCSWYPYQSPVYEKHFGFLQLIVKHGYGRFFEIHSTQFTSFRALELHRPLAVKYKHRHWPNKVVTSLELFFTSGGLEALKIANEPKKTKPTVTSHLLARCPDYDILEYVLDNGFVFKDDTFNGDLEEMYGNGDLKFVKLLASRSQLTGVSLSQAARLGYCNVVRYLYESGINIPQIAIANAGAPESPAVLLYFIDVAKISVILELKNSKSTLLPNLFKNDRRLTFEQLLIHLPEETLAAFQLLLSDPRRLSTIELISPRILELVYQYNGNHQYTLPSDLFKNIISQGHHQSLDYINNSVTVILFRHILRKDLSTVFAKLFESQRIALSDFNEVTTEFNERNIKMILPSLANQYQRDLFFVYLVLSSIMAKTPSNLRFFIAISYQSVYTREILELLDVGSENGALVFQNHKVDLAQTLETWKISDSIKKYLFDQGFDQMKEAKKQIENPSLNSDSELVMKFKFSNQFHSQ